MGTHTVNDEHRSLGRYLDERIAHAIAGAKLRFASLTHTEFAGAVSGLLLKTAIGLAARHGCPREVLEHTVREAIKKEYGS